MSKTKVIVKFPQSEPYLLDMDIDIKVAQKIIGGYVEYVPIPGTSFEFIVDNEHCFKDTKPNIVYGEQVIKGPIIVRKCGADNRVVDLDEKDIESIQRLLKYSALTEEGSWMHSI